jgi:hypothetical protein
MTNYQKLYGDLKNRKLKRENEGGKVEKEEDKKVRKIDEFSY